MSSQHFKEILGILKMTKGLSQYRIARILNVSDTTIHRWREEGVPGRKSSMVGMKLRTHVRCLI